MCVSYLFVYGKVELLSNYCIVLIGNVGYVIYLIVG